jgi:L-methionine (R)-S-oxide reductase
MAENRFNMREIIDQLLIAVENNENVMEKTVEVLKSISHYTWVGIYLVEGEYLVLKHYIGKPTEHTKIRIGQGICGAAIVDKHTIIVPNVSSDANYIVCSEETKSEIVVPIWSKDRIIGEIDIDSDILDAFHEDDRVMLEKVADVLGDALS